MDQPIAYLNGQLLPADRATLSIDDAGFVLGATVTEQLRTFGGRLFRPARHFERLAHSLAICGLDPGLSAEEFGQIAEQLVAHNHRLLAPGDDLGLAIFVTPGLYPALAEGNRGEPTVGLHTFPLAFGLWAARYTTGVSLVVTPVQQVPPQCWPPEMKCRSRMHYYLADRQAAAIEANSRALLLDAGGFVTESSTANFLMHVAGEGLISPPRGDVLPGVSLEVAAELAQRLGIRFAERKLRPADVATADELFLTSTPNCILPVTRFNGRQVGEGGPGPIFARLLAAWNELVGLDIAAQAFRVSQTAELPAKRPISCPQVSKNCTDGSFVTWRSRQSLCTFQITIHVRSPETSSGPTIQLAGRSVATLNVPRDALAVPFGISFEEASERLAQLPRMFIEPDGSFVWASPRAEASWQVDGNLFDRAGRLLFVDLKGTCPPAEFDRLLAALGWPATPLVFQLVREAAMLEESAFRKFAGELPLPHKS